MIINTDEVRRIAELAHLEFREEELKPFVERFQEILDYFTQLERVPTDGVEPMSHALQQREPSSPFREDREGPSLPQELAVREGPDVLEHQFRVPRVIEE